jgi:hypothetical protein
LDGCVVVVVPLDVPDFFGAIVVVVVLVVAATFGGIGV